VAEEASAPPPAPPTWVRVAGIDAPVSIAIAPDTGATPFAIYVGTAASGVFHSADGVTWAASGPSAVTSLASMPLAKVAFASTPDGSVQFTQDTGVTWSKTAASPASVIRAWVGVATVGPLGATSDGAGNAVVLLGQSIGASWVPSAPLGSGVTTSLALGGGAAPDVTVFAAVSGAGGGVYKSTDVGASTITFTSTGFPQHDVLCVATAPSSRSTVYAGTNGQGGGFYASTDGGGSWSAAGPGLGSTVVQAIAVDPTNPSHVYAGTASGVFVSSDGGASWSAWGLPTTSVTSLAVLNGAPSTLFAVTSGGLFVTAQTASSDAGPNDGSTVTPGEDAGDDATATDDAAPEAAADAPAADATSDAASVDGGWTLVPAVASPVSIAIAPNNDGTPYAIYVGTGGGGVFSSTDGVAWTSGGPATTVALAPMPQAMVAFASLPDGTVQYTKNTGATWAPTTGPPSSVIHGWIAVAGVGPLGATSSAGGAGLVVQGQATGATWVPSSVFGTGTATSIAFGGGTSPNAIAYAAVNGSGGGVFKSSNIGASAFSFATTGFPETQVLSVATAPSSLSTVFAGTNGQGAGIYVSTNGGTTWSPAGSGLGSLVVQAIAVDPTNAEAVYAGTAAGVYVSKNGGASWAASGLAGASVTSLAVLNGAPMTVYAATSEGLYVTKTGGE
jgi:hypothetical protein